MRLLPEVNDRFWPEAGTAPAGETWMRYASLGTRTETEAMMRSNERKRVVVIGAGIVGASLAYHLASKGAHVTIVDANGIASGVTQTSFAWINATQIPEDPIALLRSQAIMEYHRLEAEVSGLEVLWTGALSYTSAALHAHKLGDGQTAQLVARAQISELEPGLRNPPEHAVHEPEQGALDAVAATHALVAAAVNHGANVLTGTKVVGFSTTGRRATGVETTAGWMEADVVVCAAGIGTLALVQMLGATLPIKASPAIFIRYEAQPRFVQSIISGPDFEIRQGADGALLAAEDFLDDSLENSPEALASRTAEAIRFHFDGIGPLRTEVACIGLRPIAADGLPVVGFLPSYTGFYVCTMHPGVTLAAVVGRLASEEILGACEPAVLLPCRPERFLQWQQKYLDGE